MKFTPLTYLVAGAVAVGSVSAAPLRVIVITSGMTTASGFEPHRITPPSIAHENMNMHMNAMHAVHQETDGDHPLFRHRPGCMKTKAVEMMNKFRAAVGWPVIDAHSHDHHHHGGHHHHHHIDGSRVGVSNIRPARPVGKWCSWAYVNPDSQVTCFRTKEQFDAATMRLKQQDTSFPQRVMDALLSLGPWEGRAVAFVLGCGLGVLIRMIWVLVVVAFRAAKAPCSSSPQDEGYDAVYAEEIFVAPPEYTYQDEKSGEVMVVKSQDGKDAEEIA